MNGKFRIGITRDFLRNDGVSVFGDLGLGLLEGSRNVEWDYLSQKVPELRPEDVAGRDGLLVEGPRVTARSLEGADRLVLVARYGAGYDGIDVQACTDAGIMVTNAPNGVRRPMAASAMTFVQNPVFLRAADRVLDACARHGKAAGFGSLDLEELAAAPLKGYRFLVYVADLWIYQQALAEGISRVRRTLQTQNAKP